MSNTRLAKASSAAYPPVLHAPVLWDSFQGISFHKSDLRTGARNLGCF